jgi:minor histocompatibility antigen H13
MALTIASRPMMVTVAKSLDVPIKLMFPRPAPADDPSAASSHAMLGLGDVVLPGIMIGLALRFDLYLFYLRRQKRTPAAQEGEADTIEMEQYHSLAGRWSDHFWTHSLTGRPLWTVSADETKPEAPFTFPKIYFRASLVGYVLGLLATVGVMMVWNHAQPALLYLVPGVLGSLWLTALARGELSLMWNYTEEIEEEGEASKKKSSEENKKIVENGEKMQSQGVPVNAEAISSSKKVKSTASHRPKREFFSFSIEAPWDLKQPPVKENKASEAVPSANSTSQHGEKHNWAPSKSTVDVEPAGKRVRLN